MSPRLLSTYPNAHLYTSPQLPPQLSPRLRRILKRTSRTSISPSKSCARRLSPSSPRVAPITKTSSYQQPCGLNRWAESVLSYVNPRLSLLLLLLLLPHDEGIYRRCFRRPRDVSSAFSSAKRHRDYFVRSVICPAGDGGFVTVFPSLLFLSSSSSSSCSPSRWRVLVAMALVSSFVVVVIFSSSRASSAFSSSCLCSFPSSAKTATDLPLSSLPARRVAPASRVFFGR